MSQELTKQQKYSKSLRNIAEWYDEHPNAPVSPIYEAFEHYFTATPEDIKSIGSGEKEYAGDLFYYVVKGDGFTLKFFSSRDSVCERKIVGYREVPAQVLPATKEYIIPAKTEPIYEYDCKPILSAEVA